MPGILGEFWKSNSSSPTWKVSTSSAELPPQAMIWALKHLCIGYCKIHRFLNTPQYFRKQRHALKRQSHLETNRREGASFPLLQGHLGADPSFSTLVYQRRCFHVLGRDSRCLYSVSFLTTYFSMSRRKLWTCTAGKAVYYLKTCFKKKWYGQESLELGNKRLDP